MNLIGMLVDLSHVAPKTMHDVLDCRRRSHLLRGSRRGKGGSEKHSVGNALEHCVHHIREQGWCPSRTIWDAATTHRRGSPTIRDANARQFSAVFG
jgi:hypothetical protein